MALFFKLLFIVFFCNGVHTCDAVSKGIKYFYFIGNMGVGKSTIINSIIGKRVADIGIGAASMTTSVQIYEREGTICVDTPGLDDPTIRNKALVELEDAFRLKDAFGLCVANC